MTQRGMGGLIVLDLAESCMEMCLLRKPEMEENTRDSMYALSAAELTYTHQIWGMLGVNVGLGRMLGMVFAFPQRPSVLHQLGQAYNYGILTTAEEHNTSKPSGSSPSAIALIISEERSIMVFLRSEVPWYFYDLSHPIRKERLD